MTRAAKLLPYYDVSPQLSRNELFSWRPSSNVCETSSLTSFFCFPAECVLHQFPAASPGSAESDNWWRRQQVSGGCEQQTQTAGVQLRSYQAHEAHLDVHSGKKKKEKGNTQTKKVAQSQADAQWTRKTTNCGTISYLLDQSSMVWVDFVRLPLHFISIQLLVLLEHGSLFHYFMQ